MRSTPIGRLSATRAAPELTWALTPLHRLTPLSRGRSRCVDGHEHGWWDRLTSLALRPVQPMRSPLDSARQSRCCEPTPLHGWR
eukprot:scaffold24749_cov31-Phaeocystis_antarctica.AAC.1